MCRGTRSPRGDATTRGRRPLPLGSTRSWRLTIKSNVVAHRPARAHPGPPAGCERTQQAQRGPVLRRGPLGRAVWGIGGIREGCWRPRYCRACGWRIGVWRAQTTRDDLAAILRYEREGVTSPILEALLEHRSSGGPETVRLAAERLLREHARWALDLDQPATALIQAAGSERDRRLFVVVPAP